MKLVFTYLLLITASLAAQAQKPDDVLATAGTRTFRVRDLGSDVQAALDKLPAETRNARSSVLEQMINQRVLQAEARQQGISVGALLRKEKAKAAPPGEGEIRAVYDANRHALGGATYEQARKQIIDHLRRSPEQQLLSTYVTQLRAKHKAAVIKDPNSPGLSPATVLATAAGQPITAKDLDAAARIELSEMQAEYADMVINKLNETIYNSLIEEEAGSQGIDAGALIAREVTNKMKDFSDDEVNALRNAFSDRLFTKYKVQVLYKRPSPLVQTVSVDDDPAVGPAGAPVTVVMFSDLQCSACAATHPILKRAISEFPGKVRFVVRDFPLESIHENAFNAALAAGAANNQGKFFEYTEILYSRQDALDTAALRKYAAELGLNVKQFELDSKSEKLAVEVRKDISDGESYSISSTPTIFINGVRIRDISLAGFRSAIKSALEK